jgi:hypothetical protein
MRRPSFPLAGCFAFAVLCVSTVCAAIQSPSQPQSQSQDVPVETVFAAVPFDLWVRQGPRAPLPWKVRTQALGLSEHQRLLGRVEIELAGKQVMTLPKGDRLVTLLQVRDAGGRVFRDYDVFVLKETPPKFRKMKVILSFDFFILPGEYKVTLALFDDRRREHNLMEAPLVIAPLKDDPLRGSWSGLPAVEFLAQGMEGPDGLFRPDVTGRLHLPLATRRPVRLEVLADVTASDLFHGSTRFYNRYLSVALPLLKALSHIQLEQGTMSVAMLDLRHRRVTFEQEEVRELDWPRARAVLAPENGPATIDVAALEQRRESPAFLQDELLRRLNSSAAGPEGSAPVHVFVVIGSPMDFYSFRNLPHLRPGSEEKCVVYYLQFELLNPQYAEGAVGNVRNMLKPLPVHAIKVRSAESIRHALARILDEVRSM